MATLSKLYNVAFTNMYNGGLGLTADTIKIALLDGTYAFSAAHSTFADVSADQLVATGYTSGGVTLANKVATTVVANSFTRQRANSTAYLLGDTVRPATGNGFLFQCVVAGTSGGSIPTYNTTVGGTTTDGSVTWLNIGSAVVYFDFDNPEWGPSVTFTGITQYVMYNSTDDQLIAYFEIPSTSSTNSTFTIVIPANGVLLTANGF